MTEERKAFAEAIAGTVALSKPHLTMPMLGMRIKNLIDAEVGKISPDNALIDCLCECARWIDGVAALNEKALEKAKEEEQRADNLCADDVGA